MENSPELEAALNTLFKSCDPDDEDSAGLVELVMLLNSILETSLTPCDIYMEYFEREDRDGCVNYQEFKRILMDKVAYE